MKCKTMIHRSVLEIGPVGADEAPPTRVKNFGMFCQVVIAIIAVLAITHLAVAQPVDLLEPAFDSECESENPDDDAVECNSGCIECDTQCSTSTWGTIKAGLQRVDNLGWEGDTEKFDLIIYQQTNKGTKTFKADHFQWNTYQWLLGKGVEATHWAVNKIGLKTDPPEDQDSLLAAIKHQYAANGNNPINVVIVGHGNTGFIKVGEEQLNESSMEKLANVRIMIKRLVLFGCFVAGDDKNFVGQLQRYIDAPVKSWTGKVYAGRIKGLWYAGKKNVEPKIPAVSEWGLGVLTLVLLTAGTVVLGRRRRSAAA